MLHTGCLWQSWWHELFLTVACLRLNLVKLEQAPAYKVGKFAFELLEFVQLDLGVANHKLIRFGRRDVAFDSCQSCLLSSNVVNGLRRSESRFAWRVRDLLIKLVVIASCLQLDNLTLRFNELPVEIFDFLLHKHGLVLPCLFLLPHLLLNDFSFLKKHRLVV